MNDMTHCIFFQLATCSRCAMLLNWFRMVLPKEIEFNKLFSIKALYFVGVIYAFFAIYVDGRIKGWSTYLKVFSSYLCIEENISVFQKLVSHSLCSSFTIVFDQDSGCSLNVSFVGFFGNACTIV